MKAQGPSKKISPVGKVKSKTKFGKFMTGRKPTKDGMASDRADKMMSKIKPGDAAPSFKPVKDTPGGATAGTMKAVGAMKKYRRKATKR